MTVESTTTRAVFTGNGITRKFPLPFPLLSASHLEVYVTPKAMVDSVVVPPLSGGYSVQDIDTAEPYVVYPEDDEASPLQTGWQLTVIRRLPLVQQTNLENGGNLHAETLEIQFDTLVMQLQQLAYDLQRSVKIPPYSANENADVADVLQKMEKLCERAEYAARRVEQQADADKLAGELGNLAATWVAEKDIFPGELMELPVHYLPGHNVLSLSVDGVLCYPGNPPEAPWGSAKTSNDFPERMLPDGMLPDGVPEEGMPEERMQDEGSHGEPGNNASRDGLSGFSDQGAGLEAPTSLGADSLGGAVHQYEEVPGDGLYSRSVRILFPLLKGTVCHALVISSNLAPLSEALLKEAAQTAERLEKLLDASATVMS